MPDKDPSLDAAYALETPQDSQRLYAKWADNYDSTFADAMDYQMPRIIALIYAEVGLGKQPVLDVGAGTGLLVKEMPLRGGAAFDALDISPEMLEVAGQRGIYRSLLEADLTTKLPIEDATYGAILSAGTFTHGHVGPNAIDELVRIAQPNAVFVLGINAEHFEERGFGTKFAALDPEIRDLHLRDVNIYGAGADAAHKDDQARVAVFWKR
ncbi:MAG: class I SAM-dependent methyltransferase [Sulfitobacter sp.]